ncbi:hypothetical protein [Devosia sp. 1566]|uniref:hypothetical protein n=1 Tax=Devosia sp. 1566 TaxID=2499144 RepID=UPI0013E36347|nr:hypothetical protein [Devosia sp. 1566]
MRHHSVPFAPSHELSIPPGWVFVGLLVASWLAVISLAHLALHLFALLTGT